MSNVTYRFNSQPTCSFIFKEETASFAVGHMALAYLLATGSAKLVKVKFNLPLVLTLSIIPDIDIILGFLLNSEIHRGPTHSIIMVLLIFVPIFILYRQKAVPYFTALVSHSLIADFLIGGKVQLLWPLSQREMGIIDLGFPYINIYNQINIALEFTLFAIALVVMLKTRDLFQFFRNNKETLILAIPIFTILLPTLTSYPLTVPIELIIPHMFYLVLFFISYFVVLTEFLKNLSRY